ncbi:MAG TPA: CcoQ/FixQ family Cbb3-type cytochrome c oxidase assembly chaperone [Phycisphaerales bacterium]|nr:CcoQ/FixQ family Cbb3-type cytochrome c oxidase assembly chaperone [Phycisphaerales bacterium]HMP37688.1 CcoQ/FixQ family Cbb3-type cytochrome c oxidase assembly chaperone [Phycisphaerales bacterium]
MSLGDIVGRLGLWFFPTVAMVLFAIAFAAVILRACAPSRRAEMDRAAHLPLDDAPSAGREAGDPEPTERFRARAAFLPADLPKERHVLARK